MRPDPARLPVRRSTNDRPTMLLGPQRYAVVRLAIYQRCEWDPVCCMLYAGLSAALLLARVPMLVRKTAGTQNSADRGVIYPTLDLTTSSHWLRGVFCGVQVYLFCRHITVYRTRPASLTCRNSVPGYASHNHRIRFGAGVLRRQPWHPR
jgi:hypothetical protein